MALGSFAGGALADLTIDDLERMLDLNETLFVEHKRSIGNDKGSVYGLVSNVAAFANTLGGWLLIGVQNGKPTGNLEWAQEDAPSLVDAVRDRLRNELDPMPAFEARILDHPDGPVGVVRIYESSDTPHIAMRTGAVFVREVAGVGDANEPKKSGAGLQAERVFRATQIRSRAQLLELAARGQKASDRVGVLLDPLRPLPLIASDLGLGFEYVGGVIQPARVPNGRVFVRLAPYTLPTSFQGWATTAAAASAVISAAEGTSGFKGLNNNWAQPHPAGISLLIPQTPAIDHADAAGLSLNSVVRLVLDGVGVAAACIEFAPPSDTMRRDRVQLDAFSEQYVMPALRAAAHLLQAGHVLGRSRCQIDLVGMGAAVLLAGQPDHEAASWVPSTADIALPASDEALEAVALRATYAFARSAGIAAWDPSS